MKLKYFSGISLPGMWGFTSEFLSPIGSLDLSQILDSLLIIIYRVSKTFMEVQEPIKYMV